MTDAGKWGLRHLAMLDADSRPPPDFLVIGSKRGGTTSLWEYLSAHPGVMPLFPAAQKIKGVYYFDENYARGPRWYLSHFPTRRQRAQRASELGYDPVAGEATPYYLYHPLAPYRARALCPDAVIIAVLRNPIERSFSHWKERCNHTESLPFMEALLAEEERTEGEELRMRTDPTHVSFPHRHQSYVDQSRYSAMLERWFDAYGSANVLVEAAEDFYADPRRFLDEVTDRLGIPPVGEVDLSPRNSEPSEGMSDEARSFLEQRLRPDIVATQELLGRALPW